MFRLSIRRFGWGLSLLAMAPYSLPAQRYYNMVQNNIASYARQNQIQNNINAMRDIQYNFMRSQMQYQLQQSRNQPSFYSSWRGEASYSAPRRSPRVPVESPKAREMRILLEKFKTTGKWIPVEFTYAGMQFLLGIDGKRNTEFGLKLLTEAADPKVANWHYAQYLLGELYRRGELIPADTGQSRLWYERAAGNGNIDAQLFLAGSYLLGENGFDADPGQARRFVELLERSFSKPAPTSPPQQYNTIRESGRAFEASSQRLRAAMLIVAADKQAGTNTPHSRFWVERAIELGCGKECVGYVASLYFDNKARSAQNDAAFFRYARQAAELGIKESEFYLCYAYIQGIGTEPDPRTGLEHCWKAIDSGVFAANRIVGDLMVDRATFDAALQFYDKGISAGDAESVTNKGLALIDERNPNRDAGAGIQLLEKAASQSTSAAYALGVIFDQGDVVPRDPQRALKWMESAGERGDVDAQGRLSIWYTQGGRYPADEKRAQYWQSRLHDQGWEIDLSNFRAQAAPQQDTAIALPLHGTTVNIPKALGSWKVDQMTLDGKPVQVLRRLSGFPQYAVAVVPRKNESCVMQFMQTRLDHGYLPILISDYKGWFLTGLKVDPEMSMFCRDIEGYGMLMFMLAHSGSDGATAFKDTVPLLEAITSALYRR